MSITWVVYVKELRDAIRDRRAWLIVLISALFAGPLVMLLLSNWISDVENQVARREVVLTDPSAAPSLVNFIARNGGTVIAAPADYEAAVADGRLGNAVFQVPSDFEARLARGVVVGLPVIFDDRHEKAQAVGRAAIRLVLSYNRELGAQRLMARGLSPSLLTAIELDERNLAPARARSAQLLFIVPWVALLVSVAGALAMAIDVTAGERERGSLEPLLCSPVAVHQIVLGKWAAVASFAIAIALLTLVGFRLAMPWVNNDTLSALLQLGVRETMIFVALMVPFAALMAAVNMFAAAYGHSFKEAQTYVSYIMMLVNLAPLAPLLLQLGEAWWLPFVPAIAQQSLLMKALRGSPLSAFDLLMPAAICLGLTALALWGQSQLLRRESVLFGRH